MTEKDKKQGRDLSSTPRSELRVPNSRGSELRDPSSAFEKQKILIVDDRQENLVALRQVLSDVDAQIIEATTGNQALAMTFDHNFSLAILDVQMPEMDGYELAELLRGDPKTANLPIIFMTAAYGEEIDVFKGYEAGAVDYIVKPYKPAVLMAKVRVFLDLQRAQKELARRVLELSASEERYRTLVTTIPDIVYRIDTEGRFTFLNDAVRSLGYGPEELIGLPFAEIVIPADVENVSRRFVLPRFAGKRTGDEGAPKLFDERRKGSRQTLTMEVRLVSRRAERAVPAELHSGGRPVLTAEVNSSGLYGSIEGRPPIFLGTVGIIRDISQRKEAEVELSRYRQRLEKMVKEQTVELEERVKEVSCLFAISSLFTKPFKSIDEALKSAADLIPTGWQHPEVARARLVFEGREFTSEGFRETPWKLSADIVLSGETVGTVEVCYLEESPALDEGPFLKEERGLIDELARQIAMMIQREHAHVHLEHINGVLRSIRDVNKLIVHEKQRGPLIQMVCENLTHTRRSLQGAWIVLTDGLPDRVEGAQTGFNDIAFSELLNLFQRGETPACFRHCQTESGVNVTDDPAAACRNCSLADTYGGSGAITIELKHGNRRYGCMGIAVPNQFANDEEEASLFEEIASDIAFALASIEQEEAVKEAEGRYRAIFEGAAEGILVADMEIRRFRYCNPAICEMLGYTEEELIGLVVTDIHPKESLDHVLAEFEAQAHGDRLLAPNLPCLRKDGCVVYADVQTTSIVIDGRGCNVGFFTDVTKRRQIEEQFRQAQKMEAIGTLTGGIAHDFNNLLSVIIGNAELLDEEIGKDDPKSKFLDEIKHAGHRATTLIRQLLAFSRKQIIQPEVINLNETIIDLEKMLGRIIGEDVDLEMIASPGLWLVSIDPGQVEQVIMNLAVNARDAMPKGGNLTIETANVNLDAGYFRDRGVESPPGPYVMIAVSDTGVGMDEQARLRAFEPFFTTKEKGKGTGLGLSTVYGIVKQNNGHIWTYSEPGQGTTIKIYLPRAKEDTVTVKEEKAIEGSLKGSETILLVEDDHSLRKLAKRVLAKFGYNVLDAKNGKEALRIFREYEGPIELALTDVVMPDMSGAELVKHLLPLKPDLKVIYMSGYTDNAIAHHGVLDRGINFVEKPFSAETLAGKVRKALDAGRPVR